MLPSEQKRIQRIRDAKAETIKGLRRIKNLSAEVIRRMAYMKHGESTRIQPEVLADYWPCQLLANGALASVQGDSESWTEVFLIPKDWDDYDIFHQLGVQEYYEGPGRVFARHPYVETGPYHTIVRWSGGWDI